MTKKEKKILSTLVLDWNKKAERILTYEDGFYKEFFKRDAITAKYCAEQLEKIIKKF